MDDLEKKLGQKEEEPESVSSNKMRVDLMKKAEEFAEKPEWLNKLINLSDEIFYLTYLNKKNKKGQKTFTENYFRNDWGNSLYALAGKKIPVSLLIELCEKEIIKDPSRPFSVDELNGEIGNIKVGEETIKDLCKEQKLKVEETLEGLKNSIQHNNLEKLKLTDTRAGKIIYHNYFKTKGQANTILNHLAFIATRAKGYDTYMSFNKKKGSFFIQLENPNLLNKISEELNEKFPGCATVVQNAMIHGTIDSKLTEEIFLNIVDPVILKNAKLIQKKTEEKISSTEDKDSEKEKIETEINSDDKDISSEDSKEENQKETTAVKQTPYQEEIIAPTSKKEAQTEIKERDKENSTENLADKPKEEISRIFEAEKKLEEARQNYVKEYKRCKSEADKASLIQKTKNKILNFFKSRPEDKIKIKPEDFFTNKTIEAKNAYTKAKIEMGNEMFKQKKSELEKAGLKGNDLNQALEQYKAVEILGKTIIEERQKVIEARAEKPALLKRMLDWYLKIKPKWKRVALSTIIFLPLAATGALGASAIAAGGIYAGVAGLAVVKFTASMAIGAVAGHAAKGIDWAKKGSDLKFAQNQYDRKVELQEKFSKEEIGLEEYEKELDQLEKIEKKRNRDRLILKGVVGAALAMTAGYVAYDALGNGLENLAGSESHIDTISGPDAGEIKNGATILGGNIKHEIVEATANNGQGAISTIRELQDNLKLEYKDNLDNMPISVKHILETDAHKLAQEFGMYKPGQDAESLLFKSGSSFKVDGFGNLTYHDVDTNSDATLLTGGDIKVSVPYEGKMVDSDNSGIDEYNQNSLDQNGEYGISQTQVDPEINDLNNPNFDPGAQESPEVNDLNNPNLNIDTQTTTEANVLTNTNTEIAQSGLQENMMAPDELEQLNEYYLHQLFPTEKLMNNWNSINNNISAERLIELSNKGEINPAFEPLGLYIKNLSELADLKPEGAIPMVQPAETISNFTQRAYERINELGKLDEIKVVDNSNIETYPTDTGTTNLEEIIKSTNGTYEANIDHLKDLKEITSGYEGLPGQLPLKMIMENVSGKGLHSVVSEDVAETQAAAMMASNFKMNNIMSSVGGNTYGDYYFDKVLPNGNVKLIHIKFYK